MTIPIIPGPFAAVGEAGQALGDIAAEREKRKERAQKIAEAGSNFVMQQILQGGNPEILDDPGVAKMMQTAFGFAIPSKAVRNVGGAAAAAGAKGRAEIARGVPEASAAAEKGEADVSAAGSTAALADNLPQLDADTKAAVLQAQREGAKLNLAVFQGARELLGTEPEFTKWSYWAATGALEGHLRTLEYARAGMTLERQAMADRIRGLGEQLQGALNARRQDAEDIAKAETNYFALHPDADTPANRAAWEAANKPKSMDTIMQELYGQSMDEFRKDFTEATTELNRPLGRAGAEPRPAAPAAAPGGGKPPTSAGDVVPFVGRTKQIVEAVKKHEPDEAGSSLKNDQNNGKITAAEVRVVIAHLRAEQPASWMKKFLKAFGE